VFSPCTTPFSRREKGRKRGRSALPLDGCVRRDVAFRQRTECKRKKKKGRGRKKRKPSPTRLISRRLRRPVLLLHDHALGKRGGKGGKREGNKGEIEENSCITPSIFNRLAPQASPWQRRHARKKKDRGKGGTPRQGRKAFSSRFPLTWSCSARGGGKEEKKKKKQGVGGK